MKTVTMKEKEMVYSALSRTPDSLHDDKKTPSQKKFNESSNLRDKFRPGYNLGRETIIDKIKVYQYAECDEFSTPIINDLLKYLEKEA